MTVSPDEIRRRFKACGLKLTPQRAAIYKALVETTNHPTAEALHRQVTKVHPMISPNTVYYTLGVLREAGLVREVNYWHDRTRFDANMTLHHHLICLGCRRIEDLTDTALDCLTVASGEGAVSRSRAIGWSFTAIAGAVAGAARALPSPDGGAIVNRFIRRTV